jgi:Fe-S oxidoreductase
MALKSILVLMAFLVSLAIFGYRVYRRYEHLRLGQPAGPFTRWGERIKAFGVFFLGQRRLFRILKPGTAHFFIFWGFLLLFPTIVEAIVEGVYPGFVLPVLGTWGPVLLLQDLVALAVIIGVLYGLYLRVIVKPERYRGSHQAEGTLVLCFILIIMLSLLFMNGIEQNLGESAAEPSFWQPVSTLLGWPFSSLDAATQLVLYEVFYWIHLGVVLVFLMMLPGGKHFHVVTSAFSVLLGNLEPRGKLPPAPHFDGVAGVEHIEQFTWRQMLDWYSCTECGRCQDVCPAYASGLPLSPKLLVMDLRAQLFERGNALQGHGNGTRQAVLERELTVDVIPEDVLWSCTTCYACDQECPLLIEHIPLIVDMRRYLLTQQRADAMLTGTLANLRRYGNSFGKSAKQRAMWSRGIKPRIKDIRKEPAHTLWYVGDYASYSTALTEITRTTATVFRQAGLDFGLLYDAERNTGNDVRRAGEEGLFELLQTKNRSVLDKCQFEQIVTTDPHSYHTLKKEYGFNGEGPPVYHYSEVLDRALASGQLTPARQLGYTVTYHDPCYLGRYNGIYEAPRRVLEAIGCRVVEMPRNRDRALCCGAGGGRIWMDEGQVKARPAEERIHEAAALDGGVQAFVVACPKDVTMYKDAVKATGYEDRMVVKDLIELVSESLEE